MKIERFNVALTSSDKFIELQPDPEGSLCFASEVAKLEAINAELLKALKLLLAECEHQAWIGNMPDDRVEFGIARAAIVKAKGETL